MAWWVCKGEFKGYINITSTANATVTATTGTSSYSAVCNSSGVGQIKVKKKGAYTITSTGTYRTASATVTDKTPVTAVYTWQKWDSQLYYYQTYREISGSGTQFIKTNLPSTRIYSVATSYSFNEANGVYTLSGGEVQTMSRSYSTVVAHSTKPYCTPQESASGYEMIQFVQYNVFGDIDTYGSYGVYISNTSGRTNLWGSASSYRKGSTQYANATGTTLDALPQNGRNTSDGYWYIAA